MGKKIGKGTEFDREGKIVCQAEYKNGVKEGHVIEYYGKEGTIKFKGTYKNNSRYGNGVEFF